MKISNAFPSKYLKAADLGGRTVNVVIARVEMEELGNKEHKPVAYFRGKEKGMVLNKTNADNIAAAYGDDTDDWEGQEIQLFEIMTDFNGKVGPALRVRIPPRKRTAQPAQPVKAAQQHDDLNPPPHEDVPF